MIEVFSAGFCPSLSRR